MNDLEKYVDDFLGRVAREQDMGTAQLLKRFAEEMQKSGATVGAIMERPQTTIDAESGDMTITRKGVMKGFGKGFKDYLANSIATVDIEANTGQFPQGHKHAGKWAVQILLSPLGTQDQANTLCDKVTPKLRYILTKGAQQ